MYTSFDSSEAAKPHTAKPHRERSVTVLPRDNDSISLCVATASDREWIYRSRHEIYAGELGQHNVNPSGSLRDSLDDWNIYLVAKVAGGIVGFISITPPNQPSYSIDKYFARAALQFPFDDGLY